MLSDAPVTPPGREHRLLRWFGFAVVHFLVFSTWFCSPLCGQDTPVKVSRETTYITEPLGPDGLPDYERYVLEKYREGVTPENNAAVLLWQVMWPGELEPSQYGPMAKELGLKEIPTGEDSLKSVLDKAFRAPIISWLKDKNKIRNGANGVSDDAYAEQVDLIVDRAMSGPWTSEQIPPLAKWIKESQPALDLAVDASRRPRYFSPSPSCLDGKQAMLLVMLLPDLQGVRNVGRFLKMRAMQHVGEGRPEKAWDDLLAIYRLARLVKQGPTVIDQLVAIALNNMAGEGTVVLLDNHDVKKRLAQQVQKELAELGPCSSMVDRMDHMERLEALDAVLQMRLHGPGYLSEEPKESDPIELQNFRAAIDWNVVLEDVNQWYDRLIAAARTPGRTERMRRLSQLEAELTKAVKENSGIANVIRSAFSIRNRSLLISHTITSLMIPAIGAAIDAEDRGNTEVDLLRLAAALAVYRAEDGAYPEKLDALVPNVLPKVPLDLYHEKPFLYKRDGDGYVLYSAGPNGFDDDGSNEYRKILKGHNLWEADVDDRTRLDLADQIPPGADDISIRVPTPPFKLPEPEHIAPGQ